MIDINFFIKSLKISWFQRLVNNNDNPLIYLFKHSIAPVDTITQLGSMNSTISPEDQE